MAQRVSSPVLVGRDSEVARLRAALGRAAAGEPATVVVGGEAGVGKTRLVRELMDRAGEAGAVTLAGGCLDVGDGVLAYAPLVDATRSLAGLLDPADLDEILGNARGELAKLVPELGPRAGGTEPVAPARLFELLLGVLTRLAGRAPVLLVAEDIHWADQSTRDLLGFLVRKMRAPVCTVLTYRSDDLHRRHPLRPFLAELERSGHAERLDLGTLGGGELRELVGQILGARPSSGLVAEIRDKSEGNPFFAEELLAARRDDDSLPATLPTALRDVVLARVETLSGPAQRVLQLAAVAGRRVDHQALSAVSGQPVGELVGLLREAVAHHVLVAAEDGSESYAFRHALVQEAIYDDLLPVERAPLHAEYARALTARTEARPEGPTPQELGQLAHHWYAAHDLGAALLASVAAGQATEDADAPAEALQHYERALELWAQTPAAAARSPLDRVALLRRAAEAAFLVGSLDRAIALIGVALDGVDPAVDPLRAGALLDRLSRYRYVAGDIPAAMAAIERALATVPAEPPSPERAGALATIGQQLMLAARHTEARVRCDEAVAMAHLVGERVEEGRALATLTGVHGGLGSLAEATAAFERACAVAEEVGAVDDLFRAHNNLATSFGEHGRWEDAAALFLRVLELADRFGTKERYGGLALADAAECLIHLGRWDEARELLDGVAGLDTPAFFAMLPLQARALYRLRTGDLAGAGDDLDRALERWPPPLEPQYAAPQFTRLALVALGEGRLADARAAIAEGLAAVLPGEEPPLVLELCHAGLAIEAEIAAHARARRVAADAREARSAADDLLGHARTAAAAAPPTPIQAARMLLVEAEAARVAGTGTPEQWSATADAWCDLSCPYELGYARLRQAEAMLAGGAARGDVTPVLGEARRTAARLGARLLLAEITALARRTRIDLDADPGDRAAVVAAPGDASDFGLTPRECEVLALVTEGRTNRQIAEALFISGKTVSVHVSNLMAKLGAANRGEAAAIAHRLDLV